MFPLPMARYLACMTAAIAVLSHSTVSRAQLIGTGPKGVCRQAPPSTGGNVFPGKYFERKASEYLSRDDATSALAALEHAAYYGNRDAQYRIAMFHLKGDKKIPIDVPLGVAWLQIGSQYGHSPSISALQKLESELTPEQQKASVRYLQNLKEKYSVAATRPRVMNLYQRERGLSIFAEWVCKDGVAIPGDKYIAEIDEEFTDYVTTMYGKVTVEPLETVPNPSDKK